MSICAECGAELATDDEYHPYAFCVLTKADLDPWREIRTIALHLGLDDPGPAAPPVALIKTV